MKYPCLYNSFPVTYQLQKYLADWIKNIYYSGSPDSVEVLPSRFENVPPAFKSFSSKKKTKKSKKLPTYCVFCKVGSYIKYSCHLSKSIHDSNWFLQQVSIQFFESSAILMHYRFWRTFSSWIPLNRHKMKLTDKIWIGVMWCFRGV